MLNGTNVSINEIPSQVGLLYLQNGFLRYGGAGSIISHYWVVTVAHCTCWTGPGDDIMQYVSSGSNEYDDGDLHTISEIKCHPDYGFNRTLQVTYNDVALVRVTQPFSFGYNRNPIRLFDKVWQTEDRAIAYGWGSVRRDGIGVSRTLKKIAVKITPVEQCQHFLKFVYQSMNVSLGQICGDGLSSGYICYGDSGGSLVQNGKLLGLISWIYSDQCGIPKYPGVFVDIRVFSSWILQTIRDSSTGF